MDKAGKGLLEGMFFFFNDTATTEIYTLSLHDALPISGRVDRLTPLVPAGRAGTAEEVAPTVDRKSTRLNSSHANISYAVFCLKKKKKSNVHHSDADEPMRVTGNIGGDGRWPRTDTLSD